MRFEAVRDVCIEAARVPFSAWSCTVTIQRSSDREVLQQGFGKDGNSSDHFGPALSDA
jgi:hypothetical protein